VNPAEKRGLHPVVPGVVLAVLVVAVVRLAVTVVMGPARTPVVVVVGPCVRKAAQGGHD